MDLLERYLGAVRWNLPAAKADDILEELRDVLTNRIEEREERLDRALTADEISALLRDFGHPLIVASRYTGQQSLIGPDIFPFYLFSLKVVMAISVAWELAQIVFRAIFSQHGALRIAEHAFNDVWWTLLAHAGLVTLIFAVIERTGWLTDYLGRWEPQKLPDFRIKPKRKRAWESATEVAVGIAFALWWVGAIHVPMLDNNRMSVAFAPVWASLYWPILVLAIVQPVLVLVQWLSPQWKLVRGALSLGGTLGALAVLFVLHQAGRLVTMLPGKIDGAELVRAQAHLDQSIQIMLAIAAIVWISQCVAEFWRLAKGR